MYLFLSVLAEPMGDTEFVAAFYHLVLPIARQFNPDLVSRAEVKTNFEGVVINFNCHWVRYLCQLDLTPQKVTPKM